MNRLLKYTFVTSIYRRPLPDSYIRLNSVEGKAIFKEALIDGSMQCYFPLAQQFITQAEPQTCGPTSLVMVLNSLNVDPGKQWKGIWRWYTQDNLNLITKQILKQGIDLQAWTHIAQHNHLDVMTFYHPKADGPHQDKEFCEIHKQWLYRTARYDTFKDCVLSSARRDSFILTLNHSRKRMGQTGDGHYSPIGGYNKNRNLSLMLDVARYKYPSYWCDTQRLFESLQDMDKSTKKPRGFVLISRKLNINAGVCRTSSNIDFPYVNLFQQALVRLHQSLKGEENYKQKFIEKFVNMFTHQLRSLVVYYLFQFECHNSQQARKSIFSQIKSHSVYELVSKVLSRQEKTENHKKLQDLINDFTMGYYAELLSLILLSLPKSLFESAAPVHPQFAENIKLFRKCFMIFRQEPKNFRFQ